MNITASPGFYFLAVYQQEGGAPAPTDPVLFQSNVIEVIEQSGIDRFVYLQYRNSDTLFNYNFDVFNGDYINVFLELNLIESQGEEEFEQYKRQSSGERELLKSQFDEVLIFEAMDFDDGANDMMKVLGAFDDIKINNEEVKIKTTYKIEPNRRTAIQRGVIEFYLQSSSTINLYNQT